MISLLHPSRGRAEKSFINSIEWAEKAGCDTELIVSIDSDDKEKELYYSMYGKVYYDVYSRFDNEANPCYSKLIINDNQSVVEATNRAAKEAKGDIFVYLSDDFKCPDNWGKLILEATKNEGPLWLLKVDDCLQQFAVPVLTIPIMSRGLYERLGYFWHPGYRSMFCDEHLYWVCKKMGILRNAPHLKFPHEHCSIGKADNDETYKRSASNWEQGKALFAKHKAEGFII